ncbi:hypothetical protein ACFPER_01300 [Agromyces aurantiacus]|uniref:WXG100 family type VII secretion target n=1 Tax=Agromyces aurantiacus TaxID=165814 RepID=A0ABV9R0N2_9MICO|nr:hypothetical protein [Agromyces aurantiacus]MBM7505722.1 hypothetical protein [Agromyces aurantiacus]
MDRSPAGHEISVVTGNASSIKARGREVEELGDQMVGAAGVLRAIADGGVPQHGLSIEKIKEVIGEIDEELKLAGQRYRPSGSALVGYADALAEVQEQMRLIVPRCREAWDDYLAAQAAFQRLDDPLSGPVVPTAGVDGGPSPEQEAHEREVTLARGRADDAYDDFVAEARAFDTQYETWEQAFETAADGLREATDGGISDGFWDDVDGVVAGVLVVLQWAGIVLAVLAFVIGGPIIAALGAIVAVTTLLLTIYQKSRGDAGWLELGVAIVGVIPFGSIAKFAGGFKPGMTGFLDDMVGGLGTAAGRSTISNAITRFPDVYATSRVFQASPFTSFTAAMRGGHSTADMAARLMGIGFGDESERLLSSGWGAAGHVLGHYGWVVNSPVAAGMGIADAIGDLFTDDVETWEAQLAA